jgi:hypothetical protein
MDRPARAMRRVRVVFIKMIGVKFQRFVPREGKRWTTFSHPAEGWRLHRSGDLFCTSSIAVVGLHLFQRRKAVFVCIHGIEEVFLRIFLAGEFAVVVLVGGLESLCDAVACFRGAFLGSSYGFRAGILADPFGRNRAFFPFGELGGEFVELRDFFRREVGGFTEVGFEVEKLGATAATFLHEFPIAHANRLLSACTPAEEVVRCSGAFGVQEREEIHAIERLVLRNGDATRGKRCGMAIKAHDGLSVSATRFHLGLPLHEKRHADAAFVELCFLAAQRVVARGRLRRGAAVVGIEEDERVRFLAEFAHLCQHATYGSIQPAQHAGIRPPLFIRDASERR